MKCQQKGRHIHDLLLYRKKLLNSSYDTYKILVKRRLKYVRIIRCKTTICVKVLLSNDGSEDSYDRKSLADMIGQPA